MDEVKAAYRKLARDNHPDRNPGDEKALQRFKEANDAFDFLDEHGVSESDVPSSTDDEQSHQRSI